MKTDVPRVPRHAVDRPALRARLDAGVDAPLTLIVAPAGSGKTVLLSQWARSRRDLTLVWLDIAPSDADALTFGRRLVDAIGRVGDSRSRSEVPIGGVGGGLGEAVIDALADDMKYVSGLVVVFDDLHHLAGTDVLSDLWRLAERLPETAHFVFVSRMDLKLGWSRHRLTHGLVELRQAQLAFDDDVTARVLERITGMKVSSNTAAAVTTHTEGWAAGVQLSALSMRSQDNPEQFADHLGDSDRLIVDYLTEEVFDAQSPRRRRALLRMSVLDELCAALVTSVAGVREGEELLLALERESMFITAVPGRIGWYRFHPLFRDLLRYRLRASDADSEPRLLRAAADWHLAQGDTTRAVEYLIRAREWSLVCDIVLASGRDAYERLRTPTIARWLSLLPADVRRADPRVELLYGMVVGMSGRGAHTVEIMNGLLAADVLDIGGQQVALTYLATCVYFQPHPNQFLAAAQRSLALLAEHPAAVPPDLLGLTTRPLLEAVSYVAVGRAQLLLGNIPAARLATEAAMASGGSDYGPYRVQILGTSALIEAWAGRLQRATALADEALELARELSLLAHPAPADALIARALVAIQQGEPKDAVTLIHEGSTRAAANQRSQLMWLAQLAAALLEPLGADPTSHDPAGVPPPAVALALTAADWRRARLNGAPRAPARRAESQWTTLAFEHVAALLERGEVADARALLTGISYTADPSVPASHVEYQLAWAWLEAAGGRGSESRAHLTTALDLAESEWLAYPVVTAGPAIRSLIDALPGRQSAFRRTLLQPPSSPTREIRQPHQALTARELELLEYLPTRLTNIEIAQRFYVSVNTIKTHMAHMYRKLGVSSRTEAIVAAREMGMLPEATASRPA